MNSLRLMLPLLLAASACDTGSGNAGELEPGMCLSEVLAEDYGQSCQSNADCIAIYEGDVADPCRCINAGIAAEDFETYASDLGPDSCYDPLDCAADCAGIIGDRGACIEGQCMGGVPFNCGDEQCNGLNESCVRFGNDIAGEPDGFSCIALPPSCEGSTDCECFRGSEQPFNVDFCLDLGSCEYSGGSFRITCPGG